MKRRGFNRGTVPQAIGGLQLAAPRGQLGIQNPGALGGPMPPPKGQIGIQNPGALGGPMPAPLSQPLPGGGAGVGGGPMVGGTPRSTMDPNDHSTVGMGVYSGTGQYSDLPGHGGAPVAPQPVGGMQPLNGLINAGKQKQLPQPAPGAILNTGR